MLLTLRKKQNSEQSREGYGRRAGGDRCNIHRYWVRQTCTQSKKPR